MTAKNIACLGLFLGVFGFCGVGNLFWWAVGPAADARPSAHLRLHLFNSTEKPLALELRVRSRPRSDPPEKNILLAPGGAMVSLAWHADTLDYRVLSPDGLSHLGQEVVVAPNQRGNMILDFGGNGTFYRVPVTYFPEFWTEDAQQRWFEESGPGEEEVSYSGASRHEVVGRIDYGLGVSVPDSQETKRDDPFIQWKLASEIERFNMVFESFR